MADTSAALPTSATADRHTIDLSYAIVNCDLDSAAIQLFEALLTIQRIADTQWPSLVGEDAMIRAKFRIGLFPPRVEKTRPATVPMAV